MAFLSDIEIAQQTEMQPIGDIADALGIGPDMVEPYGSYKAKIDLQALQADKPDGKLVLVTAITPTPAGEGKTTTTVGLADGAQWTGIVFGVAVLVSLGVLMPLFAVLRALVIPLIGVIRGARLMWLLRGEDLSNE